MPIIIYSRNVYCNRPVIPERGSGVPWQPRIWADKLTLSQPGGADYAYHISTGTPGFSDLPMVQYKVQIWGIFFCFSNKVMVYVRLEMGLEVLKREQKGKINNLPLIYRLLSLIWKATFASVYIFLPLLLNMQDCQFCLLSQPVIPNSAKHWHRFGHGSDLVNPFALGNCNLTASLHCWIV